MHLTVLGLTDQPDELRERAARVRQHAATFMHDSVGPKLLAYADELDALAKAIEETR
jgi:hypothetical protein